MYPETYLDECVHTDLAGHLRRRGISATTAVEAGTLGYDDESQLLFAAHHGWVLVSHNQRHFYRLHQQFEQAGRSHGGIILVPSGRHALVALRTVLLVHRLLLLESARSQLIRWHDLQQELIGGFRLDGFDETDVRAALGIDPIEL
ncbi:MAG: DUF5615 family PIN-like protein [Chloroflexota bacterium]